MRVARVTRVAGLQGYKELQGYRITGLEEVQRRRCRGVGAEW